MGMKKILLCWFVWLPVISWGMTCEEGEATLLDLYKKFVQGSPEESVVVADEMIDVLALCSVNENFMTYPFERVTMFKPFSKDARVRIFTWNYLNVDGSMKYFGCVHVQSKKEGRWWVKLTETTELDKFLNKQFSSEKWCGAVYYGIAEMPVKRGVGKQYALLAFQGNDALTNKKIIEILNIENKDVSFGGNVFEFTEKTKPMKRYVLEYSDQIACALRYYAKSNAIVFDHLAPRDPAFEGFYPEYGPDGSNDAFVWNKKKWVYTPAIQVAPFVEREK
jgi:hypothetical protein